MSSEGFLSRWSRRKQELREAERADGVPPDPAHAVEAERAPEAAGSEDADAAAPPAQEELTPGEIAKLPSLDELTPDMDLSLFLRKGVPEPLRKAALRRMWSLDPKIRDFVSEAREYAYDWNTPGGVPGSGVLPPSDEIARMAERIVRGAVPSEGDPEPLGSSRREQSDGRGESPLAPSPAAPVSAEPQPRITAGPSERVSHTPESREPAGAVEADREQDGGASAPPRRHGGALPL